jgi:uncharacterized membrane protein YphA (DoxX/SURF4 family)
MPADEPLIDRFFRPQPLERLEVIRILAPLAILGFMSSRILHADDWLSTSGFRIPALDNDWRQPLSFDGVSVGMAYAIGIALVLAGLATALGAFTRVASGLFCVLLVFVALADRMAAFTVSKISPMIALAIFFSPAGARYSFDAWWRAQRDPKHVLPTHVSWGSVRYFQVLLPVFYLSSGIFKAKGDWLSDPYVLWSHIHDSYQTWISYVIGSHAPAFMWTVLQAITLLFEALAPLWFALPWTRPYAFGWGVLMHLMIGLMFGPVIWFSLLMITMLIGAYAPLRWLERAFARFEKR